MAARLFVCDGDARVVLRAGRAMHATVTLLDHHGDALGEAGTASAGPTDEPLVLGVLYPAR